MRTKSKHYIAFGPEIPIVRVSDFSPLRLKHEEWESLWSIVGPSVSRNMQANVPLWLIIAAAYAEGLNHGHSIATQPKQKAT